MRNTVRRFAPPPLVAVLLALAAPLAAQRPPDSSTEQLPTIQVDVDVVQVLFSVRDKNGRLVPNLPKETFSVEEDGRRQEIRYFATESDLPLTMGLLVDVSGSQENLIEEEKRAAYQFFAEVLRKKDMAFLISFGAEAELLQDFTNSARLLQKGLDELRVSTSVAGLHPGPVPTASKPRGTILFDAVYLAAREKLRGEVGRKAIILITDGVDMGSRVKLAEAVEAAQKADAIIYSIYYYDPRAYYQGGWGFGGGGEGDLKRMSEETGGRVFKVSKRNTLSDIFKEIQQEMRSQYAIGYTPRNPEKDGRYRRIEIKTNQKGLKVQARKGYYAVKAGS